MSSQAMREFNDYEMNAMAAFVRDQFDAKYGQHWNCIVGEVIENHDDGGDIWRESGHYVYLKNGMYRFAIYKSAEGVDQYEEEHDGPLRLGIAESTQHQRYNRVYRRQQVNNFVGGFHTSSGPVYSRSKSPFQHDGPSQGYGFSGPQHHRGESGVQLLSKNRMGSTDREDQA